MKDHFKVLYLDYMIKEYYYIKKRMTVNNV